MLFVCSVGIPSSGFWVLQHFWVRFVLLDRVIGFKVNRKTVRW